MTPKKAFTLAEVLITLGIIGVVAAMTIPTLMANYQKTQYLTSLKKAYTECAQVLTKLAVDNGCVGDLECTGLFSATTTNESMGNELVKYFKVVKNCESSDGGPSITGCMPASFSDHYDGSGTKLTWLDNTLLYRFTTIDGVSFLVYSYKNNCITNNSSNTTSPLTKICGDLFIDVNGLKGPNNYGRDIFLFAITSRSPMIYPIGGVNSSNTWGTLALPSECFPGYTFGGKCSGRIMEEGWQMNY